MNWVNGNGEAQAYTRGGLDVVTAINLFFKGVLLFPVFLSAGFVGAIMMKYMIFHGVPTMNKPTEAQQERIRANDNSIGEVPEEMFAPPTVILPEVKKEVEGLRAFK